VVLAGVDQQAGARDDDVLVAILVDVADDRAVGGATAGEQGGRLESGLLETAATIVEEERVRAPVGRDVDIQPTVAVDVAGSQAAHRHRQAPRGIEMRLGGEASVAAILQDLQAVALHPGQDQILIPVVVHVQKEAEVAEVARQIMVRRGVDELGCPTRPELGLTAEKTGQQHVPATVAIEVGKPGGVALQLHDHETGRAGLAAVLHPGARSEVDVVQPHLLTHRSAELDLQGLQLDTLLVGILAGRVEVGEVEALAVPDQHRTEAVTRGVERRVPVLAGLTLVAADVDEPHAHRLGKTIVPHPPVPLQNGVLLHEVAQIGLGPAQVQAQAHRGVGHAWIHGARSQHQADRTVRSLGGETHVVPDAAIGLHGPRGIGMHLVGGPRQANRVEVLAESHRERRTNQADQTDQDRQTERTTMTVSNRRQAARQRYPPWRWSGS